MGSYMQTTYHTENMVHICLLRNHILLIPYLTRNFMWMITNKNCSFSGYLIMQQNQCYSVSLVLFDFILHVSQIK